MANGWFSFGIGLLLLISGQKNHLPKKNQGKPSNYELNQKKKAKTPNPIMNHIPSHFQLLQNEVTPTCCRIPPALPEVCFKDNTSWTHKSIFSDSRSSCISSCWTKNRSSGVGVSSGGGTSWRSGKAAPPKHLKHLRDSRLNGRRLQGSLF